MNQNPNIIAIDGPAGSGKSSVAKEVGQKIGYCYLDTGALYRAVTLYYLRLFSSDQLDFVQWSMQIDFAKTLSNIQIDCHFGKGIENQIFLNGQNITDEIRLPEVTDKIKYFANVALVRNFVNERIRFFAKSNQLIMDGRDIGTIVFPDAKFKFYLTASLEERARRRKLELETKEIAVDLAQLMEDIDKRDKSDMERKIAPLMQAKDAILIDTSTLKKDVVINAILSRIMEGNDQP